MTLVLRSEAERLTGVSKSTITRYCKSGKLSNRKDNRGRWEFDTIELIRVFGPLKGNDIPNIVVSGTDLNRSDTAVNTLLTQPVTEEIKDYKAKIDQLEREVREERKLREEERAMARQERMELMEINKRLLPTPPEEKEKAGLLKRLVEAVW